MWIKNFTYLINKIFSDLYLYIYKVINKIRKKIFFTFLSEASSLTNGMNSWPSMYGLNGSGITKPSSVW